MTEWVLRECLKGRTTAVLSRGYGRKTTGFRWVEVDDHATDTGDEPLQVKQHFPETYVAVCEDRSIGLQRIQAETNATVVVMDDAFQHRKVNGHLNLLLTTQRNPWFKDFLLPAGNLRDVRRAKRRAHAVIVTKCDAPLSERFKERLKVNVPVLRSTMQYGEPQCVHLGSGELPAVNITCTALAQPEYFQHHVADQRHVERDVAFPDHHAYSARDFQRIQQELVTFEKRQVHVFVTAKDWVKIARFSGELPATMSVYVIRVAFHVEGAEVLTRLIDQLTT